MTDRELLEKMFEKISNIETEQQRQGDLLHQLIKNVGSTNSKLGETNAGLNSMETKFDTKLEAIETDIQILLDESLNQKREIYRLKKVSD